MNVIEIQASLYCLIKEGRTIGHISKEFSNSCILFLLSGERIKPVTHDHFLAFLNDIFHFLN